MRVLITTFCLFLIVAVSNGQSDNGRIFKPFKVDLSMGFVRSLGGGADEPVGLLWAMEPKYALSDKFSLGLRWEGAIMSGNSDNSTATEVSEGQGSFSYTLTGEYYFNTNKFRPFIGGGPGYYRMARIVGGDILIFDNYEKKFGYVLRTGFETGHFRFGLEYNGVGPTESYPNNSYLSFKISVFFGGGRIKK